MKKYSPTRRNYLLKKSKTMQNANRNLVNTCLFKLGDLVEKFQSYCILSHVKWRVHFFCKKTSKSFCLKAFLWVFISWYLKFSIETFVYAFCRNVLKCAIFCLYHHDQKLFHINFYFFHLFSHHHSQDTSHITSYHFRFLFGLVFNLKLIA